eukprot:3351886-Alexandrium_andersonii.AAC.1
MRYFEALPWEPVSTHLQHALWRPPGDGCALASAHAAPGAAPVAFQCGAFCLLWPVLTSRQHELLGPRVRRLFPLPHLRDVS